MQVKWDGRGMGDNKLLFKKLFSIITLKYSKLITEQIRLFSKIKLDIISYIPANPKKC